MKDIISPHISNVESDSDYIMWVIISKSFSHTDEDVFLGIVYLPPAESRFNNPDELDLLEIEITNMSVLHKYIFLMCDFNARTQTKKEYLDTEDLAEQGFGYDDVLHQSNNVQYPLSHCGLDYNRASKDKSSKMKEIYL